MESNPWRIRNLLKITNNLFETNRLRIPNFYHFQREFLKEIFLVKKITIP